MGRPGKLGRHPKDGEMKRKAARWESYVVSFPLSCYDLCVVAWIASLDDLKNCQVVSGIISIKRFLLLFHIIIMNFSIFCIGWSIEAGVVLS